MDSKAKDKTSGISCKPVFDAAAPQPEDGPRTRTRLRSGTASQKKAAASNVPQQLLHKAARGGQSSSKAKEKDSQTEQSDYQSSNRKDEASGNGDDDASDSTALTSPPDSPSKSRAKRLVSENPPSPSSSQDPEVTKDTEATKDTEVTKGTEVTKDTEVTQPRYPDRSTRGKGGKKERDEALGEMFCRAPRSRSNSVIDREAAAFLAAATGSLDVPVSSSQLTQIIY